MYWTIVIIQAILAGVFGWFIGELTGKCNSGEIKNFKEWKAWVLEIIFIIVLFTSNYISREGERKRTYDTKHYAIETVDTTFDADSTEVTTFKIVRK